MEARLGLSEGGTESSPVRRLRGCIDTGTRSFSSAASFTIFVAAAARAVFSERVA